MIATLMTLTAGSCTHPACMVLKGAGLQKKSFPSRCYLIQHQGGYCLVDTGYANHFFDATHGIYKLYSWVTPVTFSDSESAKNQLSALGISPAEINTIVITHFHADHISGLKDFPNARLVCSSESWHSVQKLTGLSALKAAFLPDLLPSNCASRLQWIQNFDLVALPAQLAPYTHGFSLYQNIILVHLQGHAIGQIGVFVETEQGWILLAADAAWTPENYKYLIGPSEFSFIIQHRRNSYYQTLKSLNQLHQQGVQILLTHQS